MKKVCLFVVTTLFILLLTACGGGGNNSPTTPKPPTAAQLCATAWSNFQSGNFAGAETSFLSAISTDGNYCEAYIGLAYTHLRQDNFTDAKTRFATAKTKSPTNDQSIAISVGVSFVYVKENNAALVISELSDKITGTDTFVLGNGTNVDAVDIHTLLGEAYIMQRNLGTESGSATNALDAWGQVKKALALRSTDAKALQMQAYLRGAL